MRIAIVSDIHGNLPAFEAVLKDLRQTAPDLIFHGGDLAHGGAHPAEVVDRIRDLGWRGVVGNVDEMLPRPDTLADFAKQTPQMHAFWTVVAEMASATREALGAERMAWLDRLPRVVTHDSMALVHASPETTWRSPTPESDDAEFESVYSPLGRQVVIYGHIHRPFIRSMAGMIVANSGSVSLSYDGDRRAAYLLLDDGQPAIRRVEYDVDREVQALLASGLPHADWIAKSLQSARPEMP